MYFSAQRDQIAHARPPFFKGPIAPLKSADRLRGPASPASGARGAQPLLDLNIFQFAADEIELVPLR
jgi:hypothetical protein